MPSESAADHRHHSRLFQTTFDHLAGSAPPSALHTDILFADTSHKQLVVPHDVIPERAVGVPLLGGQLGWGHRTGRQSLENIGMQTFLTSET